MATLYAKSSGGNWTAAGTWSNVSSAGVDSSGPPTAADNAVINSGSGNVAITAASVCRSLDCNGYTGTLTHGAFTLSIGDSTAGTGNIALRFATGMTYTISAVAACITAFVSTSATQQSITCNGKNFASVTFNGSGGSWSFADTFNCSAYVSGAVLLTTGSLTTNNQTVVICAFNSDGASGTRSLTLGSSSITCNGFNGWSTLGSTGLTLSAGTSTITVNTGNGTQLRADPGFTYNAIILDFNPASLVSIRLGPCAATNITISGTGVAKSCVLGLTGDITASGTFTCNGNSVINRILLYSTVLGTSRTITAATTSISNTDFKDITGAGAGSWSLAAITGLSGDCGGNSNITFTTAATQTATGTASITWSTHGWTSRVPLPQDNVVINNAFIASRQIIGDMPRLGKSISLGCTGGPAMSFNASGGATLFGSLDLTGAGSVSTGGTLNFEGRSSYTLTNGGNVWTTNVNINAFGGTLTLADAFTNNSILTLNNGTFVTNGYNTTFGGFGSSNTNSRTIDLGSGTLTLTSTSTVWNVTNTLTVIPGTSTIVISNVTSTLKSFAGAGLTYNNITFTGDNISITGNSVFNAFNINNAGLTTGLKLTSATTQSVSSLTSNSSVGNISILSAVTSAVAGTIRANSSGELFYTDYMSIKDITLNTANFPVWFAGSHSTNVSNNTNIRFTNSGEIYSETGTGGGLGGGLAINSLSYPSIYRQYPINDLYFNEKGARQIQIGGYFANYFVIVNATATTSLDIAGSWSPWLTNRGKRHGPDITQIGDGNNEYEIGGSPWG